MTPTPEDNWYVRLAGTTRGRILDLLRRSERTVNELAGELDITDNAVRGHLSILGRERLVERHGVRRGTGGKPAHLYRLTPEAEKLFPKAYAAILDGLLGSLATRMDASELEALLSEVGRRAAGEHAAGERTGSDGTDGRDGDDLRERTRRAADLLDELGGATRIEERDGGFIIRGNSCPMNALVAEHPGLCRLAEALVAAVVGVEVRECCRREPSARCAFEVGTAATG